MADRRKRKAIPHEVQTAVLAASRRRCAICFGLNRDTTLKQGQIAHLDNDPSNADQDNLLFLCLEHHDEYDSRRSQSKGITEGEVRHFREELIATMTTAMRQPVNVGAVNIRPPDDLSGVWVRLGDDDDDSAEFTIELVASSRLRVSGMAFHGRTREYGPNMGILDEFETALVNGVTTYTRHSAPGQTYTLTLRFDRGLLIASEEGWPPFGAGVYYTGRYARG